MHLKFKHPPQRVVSLVPSMTESMVDLGFGEALAGITDYCIHPAAELAHLPRLGGPKNPRLKDILSLKADLVLANWEENTRSTVEALEAAGVVVWVTFPRTVRESLEVLAALIDLFRSREATMRLKALDEALERAASARRGRPRRRYFCPIWYERAGDGRPWWMTFNRHTYSHDLLEILGGENGFANRERRYPLAADLGQAEPQDPGERDTRYPRVPLEEVQTMMPELVLLPDEPFPFGEQHRAELVEFLAKTPAAQEGQIHCLDGSLITWHGTRLGKALRELPPLM